MTEETSSSFKSFHMDSCITERNKVQFTYKWTIKEFMELPEATGESVKSEQFPSAKDQPAYWQLVIYPHGESKENEDSVSLFLKLKSAESFKVRAKYVVESDDHNEDTVVGRLGSFKTFSELSDSWGYKNCVKRVSLKESLEKSKSDTLIIHCVITVFLDFCNKSGPSFEFSNRNFHDECLSKDLHGLLSDVKYSDFVININNRKFKVHKNILHARSSVFASMLSSNMEECQTNEVTLDDVEPDVFEKVLQFIYTGSLSTLGSDAFCILPVADKYNIDSLKLQCVDVLTSQISTETAVETLILSHMHNLKDLRKVSIEYIAKNVEVVTNSDDWSLITSTFPNLTTELLLAVKATTIKV